MPGVELTRKVLTLRDIGVRDLVQLYVRGRYWDI